MAILINRTLTFSSEKVIQDKLGRFIMVVGAIGEVEMSILNLYAPNKPDQNFFKEIANVIADNAKGIMIVGGDFNAVQDGRLDRMPADGGPQTIKTKTLS